jgi:hypothetical protein
MGVGNRSWFNSTYIEFRCQASHRTAERKPPSALLAADFARLRSGDEVEVERDGRVSVQHSPEVQLDV